MLHSLVLLMVTKTHYDVLGIEKTASMEEIKAAFKKLAKKYHPDVAIMDKEKAAEEFKKISKAYNILSDNKSRMRYDQDMRDGFINRKPEPLFRWEFFEYMDSYGWVPNRKKPVWNHHHDVMYG